LPALTTTGLPASEAHTQLRAVIAGLTRTTDKSRLVFKKLAAEDFKDLIEKSGGLVPAIGKINKLLKGNSSMWLDLVGSTEALNAIIGLTGGQADVFTRALADMRDGANAVDVAFDKQNKTMSAGLTRTKNAMTSVGISIGTILAPTLEKLAVWLQRATEWFDKLSPSTKEWVVQIAAVTAVMGPALIVIGKMGSGVAVLTGAMTKLGGALLVVLTRMTAIPAALAGATAAGTGAVGKVAALAAAVPAVALGVVAADPFIAKTMEIAGLNPDGTKRMPVAAPGASGRGGDVRIQVDFANAPKGMRATSDPKNNTDVGVSVGYQMGGAF
jgi:hypothetical protein